MQYILETSPERNNEFETAIQQGNINLLSSHLRRASINLCWVKKIYSVTKEEWSNVNDGWDDDWDEIYRTLKKEKVEAQWTPLVEAAMQNNNSAVKCILQHFNDPAYLEHALSIIKRCQASINNKPNTTRVSVRYRAYLNHPDAADFMRQVTTVHDTRFNNARFNQAKLSLLLYAEEHFPGHQHQYTKTDKSIVLAAVTKKINAIRVIEDVTALYNQFKDSAFINHHVNYYTDCVLTLFNSNYNYTNSKIKFIEALQKKAGRILKHSDSATIKQLLNSELFNDKHYKNGVSSQDIKDHFSLCVYQPGGYGM